MQQDDNNHSFRKNSDETDQGMSPSTEGEGANTETKNKPGAKPRASRAGTRSVSTLNAEQLARKRANDREAQRAIRQRTREHIERLENRIKELSENSPGSDAALEAVQRRNAELEGELRQLRKTLFGMAEGSNSPSTTRQHLAFVPSSRAQINPAPYSPHNSSWVPQHAPMGFQGIPPTSNPMSEADPSWQNQVPVHNSRRTLPQHPMQSYPPQQQQPPPQQPIPWSRNESSDSDYDVAYTNERRQTGSPIGPYPDQMQNYMMQNSQIPRPGVMWQTPTSSSGSSTPYESHQQLPSMPNLPQNPTTRSDDPRMYSMKQPHLGAGMPGWGPPSPHGSDF